MFSLCIPTMDRYDSFLKKNLTEYLKNEYIDEIIITDETGYDVDKIQRDFKNISKLRLYKNERILGPFLNKIKACKLSKNPWIALIDSDNFANKNYFKTAKIYIEINNLKYNEILAPHKAKPRFDYSYLSGKIIKKGNFIDNSCLLNTGNYVIHKSLIEKLNLSKEQENIKKSSACDVIYLNTLLFEQLDLYLHIVPGLEYEHSNHKESIYLKTRDNYKEFNQYVKNRYKNLK